MSGVPNVFGSATSSIPLSQLDVNFNTPVTIGNTTVGLGNTVTSLSNVTLTNTTISGLSGGSANGVVYASSTSALVTGSGITYNGTTFSTTNDASINGLTVGKGGGSVSTNTAVGASALAANGTNLSSAFGSQALLNTTGIRNTGIGYQSGQNISTGTCNTALGSSSLNGVCTGSDNIAIGSWHDGVAEGPLSAITSGGQNLAAGNGSLRYLTTGASNTALGYSTGAGVTTASNCILIGVSANVSGAGNTNEIVIGVSGTGKGSSTGYIYPNGGGVYQGNNSTLWSVTSDQRLKKNIVDNTVGLTAINGIKVRNFEYRLPDEITDLDKSNAVAITGVQLGPIAQELQQVLPDCVKTESTGVMSVDSSDVLWHLVTAVQQLSAQVTTLQTQINGASA